MPPINEPVAFNPLWWVALGVAAALFVVWVLLVPRIARWFSRTPAPQPGPAPAPRQSVQDAYRARIVALESSFDHGDLSERELHLALSATVREYVSVRTGVHTTTMTYSDLKQNDLTASMAEVIAQCYHPAFSSGGTLAAWNREQEPTPITITNALLVVDSL